VAKLAGLSEAVLRRASEIMGRIKEGEKALHQALPGSESPDTAPAATVPETAPGAIASIASDIAADIAALDLDRMAPLEALYRIQGWKALFQGTDPPPRPAAKPRRKAQGPGLFDE
jgi:DNA mismatch repair protein MutS